jgi:hypothetical protein
MDNILFDKLKEKLMKLIEYVDEFLINLFVGLKVIEVMLC